MAAHVAIIFTVERNHDLLEGCIKHAVLGILHIVVRIVGEIDKIKNMFHRMGLLFS